MVQDEGVQTCCRLPNRKCWWPRDSYTTNWDAGGVQRALLRVICVCHVWTLSRRTAGSSILTIAFLGRGDAVLGFAARLAKASGYFYSQFADGNAGRQSCPRALYEIEQTSRFSVYTATVSTFTYLIEAGT